MIYAPSDLLPIPEGHPLDRSEQQTGYGMSKILCEDYLLHQHRKHGFPATVAAFSMVFGPRNIIPDREQRMFLRILKGRKVMIPGDGSTVGQIGHVDDEARALRMLMGQPVTFGKRYNLTGDDYYTDEGYVDTFAEVVGALPEKVLIPADLMDDPAWVEQAYQRGDLLAKRNQLQEAWASYCMAKTTAGKIVPITGAAR